MRRILLLALFLSLGGALFEARAQEAGEDVLLMITSDHCPWCVAFEEEVGDIYDRTPEAELYPLLRVDFFGEVPARFRHLAEAVVTPTFIFIKDSEEIGRIVGYPGSELFWWRMAEFLPPE